MKPFFYAVIIFIVSWIFPASSEAQAPDCSHLTKYMVWVRIASVTELYNPGINFFEEFLAFDGYSDFACEVDSIVFTVIPSGDDERHKIEFARNANGDVLTMYENSIYNGVVEPYRRLNFDWDYAANKAVGIMEDYSSGQWELSSKAEIEFNAQGLMAQFTQYTWENNAWEFYNEATYEYDSFGNLTLNPSNAGNVFFEYYERIDYAYTPDNMVQVASFSENDSPQLPYAKVEYEYENGKKTKAITSSWDEDNNTWCNWLSLSYEYQNGFPTEGRLYYDDSENCTSLENLGIYHYFTWDEEKNRLLQFDNVNSLLYDPTGALETIRIQLYYDGVAADAPQRLSARLDLRLPNPLEPGQVFNLSGLPEGGNYRFAWLGSDGRPLAQGSTNGTVQVPDVAPGIYFLRVQDMGSGNFGMLKAVVQ